jgi:hypothetical protein
VLLPFSKNCGYTTFGTSGTILSPNYPNNYGNNHYCEWLITSPFSTGLNFTLNALSTEYRYDQLLFVQPVACTSLTTYSGFSTQAISFTVAQNTAAIYFVTDNSISASGFNITWRSY